MSSPRSYEVLLSKGLSTGGSFNQKALQDYSKQVESLASDLCSDTDVSKSETEENDPPSKKTGRAKRGRAKKAATTVTRKSSRKRATSKASDSEDEGGPATTRRTRSRKGGVCETPASNTGIAGMINAGLNTPMITPKFDPRLPLTPACMREAKRGETLISMNGSPINNPARLHTKKPGLILGNGKIIDVEEMKEDTFDDGAMDETTRKNIMMLQDYLGKILQNTTTEGSD